MWLPLWFLALSLPFLSSFQAQPYSLPSTAYAPTSWMNSPALPYAISPKNGVKIRPILSTRYVNTSYADWEDDNGAKFFWSANNAPIRENATLDLTSDGGLLLHDVNGTLVWSTKTTNMSIAGMSITQTGSLYLLNYKNRTVWKSIDHPTIALLPGQQLVVGQKLVSLDNEYWISLTENCLAAYVDSNSPQMYYKLQRNESKTAIFTNGAFSLVDKNKNRIQVRRLPKTSSSPQLLRLDPDGHLSHYEWIEPSKWVSTTTKVLYRDDCDYPLVCGTYGICSNNGQCTCPNSGDGEPQDFQPVEKTRPTLGCNAVTRLSCEASKYHHFLILPNMSYFNYVDDAAAELKGTDMESCKQACMKNCSCRAAMFRYLDDVTNGDCFLPTHVLSLKSIEVRGTDHNSSVFLKVQHLPIVPLTNSSSHKDPGKKRSTERRVVLYATGGCIGALLVVASIACLIRMRQSVDEEIWEDPLDDLLEMPTRFTYEELMLMTHNFVKKLGEGGFGSVFEGDLSDGTKIAVKRLERLSQGRKEFMAEIRSIGGIHHINLVRLVGFCAEKSHRLLVYECMLNGSLEKWIYKRHENQPSLSWETWEKTLLGITKGLEYLHEGCKRRIVHLDIKPQNILLDENFNAKVSDFGLSKLLDRDQSQVMTSVRGTYGYLAPEWIGSKITEKVDVYSFGILLLEIVCGRKVLDYSQPEDDIYLLNLLKSKAKEGQLTVLLDMNCQSMQLHREEALRMMKVAVWCLQGDTSKRPSMSMVVKVLEGVTEFDSDLDYSFLTIGDALNLRAANMHVSAPQTASILSGPR